MATETKKTRTKEVFDTSELPHVWAHQRAAYGRSKSGTMFFDGPTIYSYGRHFPMARLLLDKKKKPVAVLLTPRTYSVTTSSHQSDVRSAVRHLKQFYVTDVTQTRHAANLNDYRRRIKAACADVADARARTLDRLDGVRDLIAEANSYAEFFGLKTRLGFPEGFDEKAHEARGREEAKKAADRQAVREAKERAERVAATERAYAEFETKKVEYAGAVAAWLVGESKTFPPLPISGRWPWDVQNDLRKKVDGGVRLRVHGSRIETSMGVVFQIDSAKPLLAAVRRFSEGAVVFHAMDVDGYRGVRIDYDNKTVSVGCHTVAFAEVERIATQLGL